MKTVDKAAFLTYSIDLLSALSIVIDTWLGGAVSSSPHYFSRTMKYLEIGRLSVSGCLIPRFS